MENLGASRVNYGQLEKREEERYISIPYPVYKGAFFWDVLDAGTVVQDHSDLSG